MAAGRVVLSQYFPARDRNGRLVAGALLYVYTNATWGATAAGGGAVICGVRSDGTNWKVG